MRPASFALHGGQLGGLELLLARLLGPVDGYRLPGEDVPGWPTVPHLRVPGRPEIGPLRLTDADGTALATLNVQRIAPASTDASWVGGPLSPARTPEHGIGRHLRMDASTTMSGQTVALVGGRFRALDAEAVARAVNGRGGNLVVTGSAEGVADAELLDEVCAWAELRDAVRVWYLPNADFHDDRDIPALVLRERGADRVVDVRAARRAHGGGAVIVFTGLSGAGKSTVARAVVEKLAGARQVRTVLLDGDDVRRELSGELGFDREGRERNLRRIAWVAARIAQAGGLAVCAPIAPFASARAAMRAQVEPAWPFLIVYVSTPLHVAEQRDRKGLYAMARSGALGDFTGVHSPYEIPADADLEIDTSRLGIDECADQVIALLEQRGLVTALPTDRS